MRKMSYWRFSWRSVSYFFVASKMVRLGQAYRLSALVLQTKTPLAVRASIQYNGVEIGAANSNIKIGIFENLMINDIAGLQALSAIDLDLEFLENIIEDLKPTGPRRVTKTLVWLHSFLYMKKMLLNTSLEEALGPSVKVAKFSTKDICNKQVIFLRMYLVLCHYKKSKYVWKKQGIFPVKIERQRQNVKIEGADGTHYETLLRNGLDFFGITKFSAVPERWHRTTSEISQYSVIQCFPLPELLAYCSHCTMPPRCVQCGRPHSVESCTRLRNDPFCCHCGGPHHAAYRHWPSEVTGDAYSSPLSHPT